MPEPELPCIPSAYMVPKSSAPVSQRSSSPYPQQPPERHVKAVDSMNSRYFSDTEASAVATVYESAAREAVLSRNLDRFFHANSRSFWFASLWFMRQQRRTVQRVYAFCRATDDIVDRAPDVQSAEAALDEWRALSMSAYAGRSTSVGWLDQLMAESRREGVPFALIDDLLTGVRSDLYAVRVVDWSELSLYCYRVGSVVGLWMCRLFGVTDPAVLERARALGHAMQLTNIARDVGEDLRLNRIYLPRTLLVDHGITEEDLRRMQSIGRSSVEYQVLLRELIDRANVLYEYAEYGIPSLPRGFRSAVAVASNVYRGIHEEIIRNEFDNLAKRARTSRRSKIRLAAKAIWWLRRQNPEFASTVSSPPAGVKARSGRLEVVDQ